MPATQLTATRKAVRRFGALAAIVLAVASAPPRLPDLIPPAWKVNVVNYLLQVGVTDFPTVTE